MVFVSLFLKAILLPSVLFPSNLRAEVVCRTNQENTVVSCCLMHRCTHPGIHVPDISLTFCPNTMISVSGASCLETIIYFYLVGLRSGHVTSRQINFKSQYMIACVFFFLLLSHETRLWLLLCTFGREPQLQWMESMSGK